VTLTLGLPHTAFLSPTAVATLLVSGALLGGVGGGWPRGGVRPAALAALVLVLVPAAGLAQKKDDVGAEQRKLQQTQRELREQRAKAAEARKKESSLLAELEEIDRTLAEKRAEVTRLDERIARTQAEIGGLRGDIRRLEAGRRSSSRCSPPGSARCTRSRRRAARCRSCSAARTPWSGSCCSAT